jgi:hypothetical protein
MILENQKQSNVLSVGDANKSIGMSLDLDSAQMLMQMLSKNLYSDDIGSTIRETASNALDSHRRAGVKIPIIVSLKESSSYNYEFTVEDFGTGLDDDDVHNIISKYGKSTKRETVNELGMWGLGFKSPLAYSSSFYFICRKNGVERKYMMYEGEDVNTIDLLYEEPTTEANGVKIIVPVKYSDRYTFMDKIKEQLAYFEDVYFESPGISNDFIIFRSEYFQFSELSNDSNLHICLDNVYYPIDFSKLGIDVIDFPVALRFNLTDGIYPTPNRESIRYTQEAKEIILDKISKVADFFVTKYNENLKIGDDIVSMINYLEDQGKYVNFESINKKYNINSISERSTIKCEIPKLSNLKVLNFVEFYKKSKPYILRPFNVQFYFRNGSFRNYNKGGYSHYWNIKNIISNKTEVISYCGKLSGIKKEYIKQQNRNVFLVKRSNPMKLGVPEKYDIDTYYHLLSLKNYPKNQWRDVIKDYQTVVDMISVNFINIDDITIPQSFIDSLKSKNTKHKTSLNTRRASKLNGEMSCKIAEQLLRWNEGRNCKFVSAIYKVEDFNKYKGLTIYSSHEDQLKLDAIYGIVYNMNVRILSFSEKDVKLLKEENIHNMLHINDFVKGKNKLFKKIATSGIINNFIKMWKPVFDKSYIIKHSSQNLAIKLDKLTDYRNRNTNTKLFNSGGTNKSLKLLDEMIEKANDKKLFDMSIYPEFCEISELLTNKLFFLKAFFSKSGYYNDGDDIQKILEMVLKYNKFRLNLKNYNVKTINN